MYQSEKLCQTFNKEECEKREKTMMGKIPCRNLGRSLLLFYVSLIALDLRPKYQSPLLTALLKLWLFS